MDYERPDTKTTLEKGLSEYYGDREDLVDGRGASAQAREFFRCHDTAHVVFGCGTTLSQESLIKIWSMFGTTAGLGVLRDYRLPESQEIYTTLDLGEILRTIPFALVHVPIVLWRCLRMRQRWPWSDFASYLSMPLVDIRQKFGIHVVEVDSRQPGSDT
jgi:hypothetical protein